MFCKADLMSKKTFFIFFNEQIMFNIMFRFICVLYCSNNQSQMQVLYFPSVFHLFTCILSRLRAKIWFCKNLHVSICCTYVLWSAMLKTYDQFSVSSSHVHLTPMKGIYKIIVITQKKKNPSHFWRKSQFFIYFSFSLIPTFWPFCVNLYKIA